MIMNDNENPSKILRNQWLVLSCVFTEKYNIFYLFAFIE